MEFVTNYTRQVRRPEKNGGRRMVSMVGYVPLVKTITQMMNAGKKLNAARSAEYTSSMYPPGTDPEDMLIDPTASKSFSEQDSLDYQRALINKRKKHNERIARKKAKAEAETEKPAEKPVEKPVVPDTTPPGGEK